jgi:RNA polymerase sigma factor (sigma-70 family)
VTHAPSSRLLSDALITRRAAGGNQRAFASLFERYHQDLYRYCAALLGNAEDAQDAVQNTMLKVLRALPGEQRELKLKPWLYRIAHNEAIDMIRTRRHAEAIDAEALAAASGPAEEAEARVRLQQLVSDIGELPPRQRGALVMREMSGLSYAQIGEALQTSSAAARQAIYEARLSLRQISEGREMPCDEVMRAISDHDGRVLRRRDIRAHLDRCEACTAFGGAISERRREFASLAPLPAAASAGILQGLLGGAGGGGGAGSAAGAAAGKALVGSAAVKSTAAVLAVSAIGVVAANQSGVIDLGIGDRHTAPSRRAPSTTPSTAHRSGGQAAAATAHDRAVRAVGAGTPQTARGRRIVGRASAAQRKNRSALAAPGSADQVAEGTAQSNGHLLGPSEGSRQAKGPDDSKAGDPAKETKGASATAPGHAKAPPGQAKGGTEKSGGNGSGEAEPVHPEHPEHPAHPAHPPGGSEKQPTATPEPEAEPPAEGEEAGDEHEHAKPTAE